MRRALPLLALVAVLAVLTIGASAAPAATPTDDRFAPAPSPILTELGGRPVVQLNDGGGGLPYLGATSAYNGGDWENALRTFHDSGTYTAINADNFTFGTNSINEAVNQIGQAIAPTLKLFNDAKAAKIAVFFITGRGEAVRAPTEQNLQREGYAGWKTLYLKPAGSTLSTVQYKTGARRDIESQGYRIVANVGDQFSDLAGGHAMRRFKLPNPFYFLP